MWKIALNSNINTSIPQQLSNVILLHAVYRGLFPYAQKSIDSEEYNMLHVFPFNKLIGENYRRCKLYKCFNAIKKKFCKKFIQSLQKMFTKKRPNVSHD